MSLPFPLGLIASMAAVALRCWLLTGILLRVTRLRDGWDPLALVFYTTPWPAMAAGFLLLALHAARTKSHHATVRNIVLMGGALFIWVAMSWYSAESTTKPGVLRVVHWNVFKPGWSFDSVGRWLAAQDADIIALSEAEPLEGGDPARWARHLPGYEIEVLRGNMMLLARGVVLNREDGALAPGAHYGVREVRVRGRTVTVIQGDVFANVTWSRREALARLTNVVREHEGENFLVLGDLNTPRESVHFDPLRRIAAHAFESAGTGLAETWPWPLPALAIDHAWVGGKLRAVRCWQSQVPLSDHRAVVLEVE